MKKITKNKANIVEENHDVTIEVDNIEIDVELSKYYVRADEIYKIEEKYKNENLSLKCKIDEMSEVLSKLRLENDKNVNESEKLKKAMDESMLELQNKISAYENSKNRDEELKNNNFNFENSVVNEDNCYDIVIEFNSLKSLESDKGCVINFGKNGKEIYKMYKSQAQTVVGVIGNFNKGKSFVLQILSGYKMLQGYSISTKGLSIKYPTNSKVPISIINSEGCEAPIKIYAKDCYYEKNQQELPNLLKDRTHTEICLQRYIIENSNILLIVVGNLSYTDQKLIYRLKKYALKSFIYISEANLLLLSINLKRFSGVKLTSFKILLFSCRVSQIIFSCSSVIVLPCNTLFKRLFMTFCS